MYAGAGIPGSITHFRARVLFMPRNCFMPCLAQERGVRSGTLPAPLVVGFGAAAAVAQKDMARDEAHIRQLAHRLYDGITSQMDGVVLNGPDDLDGKQRYIGNLNLSFAYVEGESLLMGLKVELLFWPTFLFILVLICAILKTGLHSVSHLAFRVWKSWDCWARPTILASGVFMQGGKVFGSGVQDLAVSSGSACTSASLEPSYVLRALGVEEDMAHTSIRFGLGRFTTEAEVDRAVALTVQHVEKLREMSPLWEMVQEGIDIKSIQWSQH